MYQSNKAQIKFNYIIKQMCYPVVREVLVYYLPHLGLLCVQYGGTEEQAHVEHGRLVSQRCASMLRERVGRHLSDRRKNTVLGQAWKFATINTPTQVTVSRNL